MEGRVQSVHYCWACWPSIYSCVACISDSSTFDGISCAIKIWSSCDLVPFGGVHDTFSSKDSPSALDSISWTHSEVSVSSSPDESVSSVLAHGASRLASHGAPL
jgi:hypothetical protein